MKVVYTEPNGAAGTYHPKLGYLESGKPFDLPGDVAGKYIESGLLTKAESPRLKARKPDPETKKKRNKAFTPVREEKQEVKDDGSESIDR